MLRTTILTSLFLMIGVFANADTTTLTTCTSRGDLGNTLVSATIGVRRVEDQYGRSVRSLIGSTLYVGGVPETADEVNCNRNSCRHHTGDEVVPTNTILYPHYRPGSDVLSSVTMETRTRILIDTTLLTNCHQTDHFPRESEQD